MNTNHPYDEMDIARFWAKVDKSQGPTACWIWTGAKQYSGYGRFWDGKRVIGSHQFSYLIKNGGNIQGADVCHSCDNKQCVNPNHLWLGSRVANMQDASRKKLLTGNRTYIGEMVNTAKLTVEHVQQIRRAHASGVNFEVLGRQYGISGTHIGYICKRKSWKHVPDSGT